MHSNLVFIVRFISIAGQRYIFLFIAGQRFEVFNIDSKQMVSKTKIHDPVCFWTWVNSDIVAMVTDTTVYHWHITKRSKYVCFSTWVNSDLVAMVTDTTVYH